MSNLSGLAKDTAIYGISSIVGKFLNYLLVPLYTYVLQNTADYGIVTNLYAWTALLLVILTYGMETGFFRFANKDGYDARSVYKTSMWTVFATSVLFAVVCLVFQQPIANGLGYEHHANFIAMMAMTVAMDALSSVPFAYLRYQKRALLFAALKLLFVVLNIAFNLLFLIILQWQDVTYVFLSNILATTIQTIILLLLTLPRGGQYSWGLLKELLRYSLPLLVLGIAGIMNQTLDRIIFPYLYSGEDAEAQLGIYGACFKVAMVMMMFTQAFRYAYEPFVFAKHKDRQSVEAYADAMKYYIIFSYLILLVVVVYLDIFKYIIGSTYWEGLRIVPIVLWTYIFQGVYFNLSFWYKLTDETRFGAIFSLIGLAITVVLQIVGVPRIGYWASCGSSLVCYFVIMLISYLVGRKHLDIPYDLRRIGLYTGVIVVLLGIFYLVPMALQHSGLLSINTTTYTLTRMALGTVLIAFFAFIAFRLDIRSILPQRLHRGK